MSLESIQKKERPEDLINTLRVLTLSVTFENFKPEIQQLVHDHIRELEKQKQPIGYNAGHKCKERKHGKCTWSGCKCECHRK